MRRLLMLGVLLLCGCEFAADATVPPVEPITPPTEQTRDQEIIAELRSQLAAVQAEVERLRAMPPVIREVIKEVVREVPAVSLPKVRVQFYGTVNCPPCVVAEKALRDAGIPYDAVQPPAWVTTFPSLAWPDPSQPNGWRYQIGFGDEFFSKYSETLNVKRPAEAGQSSTPLAEVRRILAILRPQAHETFVDYGCGDGRWLIEAARAYGCRAIGVEIDPVQAARARQAVADAGLSGRVQIIDGDATAADIKADVGVAYLYGDTLERLKPRLLKLNRFASYMHRVDGLAMTQNGDAWLWTRPAVVQQQPQQPQRYAYYGGQAYSGRVCNNPRCQMCNEIARQLR